MAEAPEEWQSTIDLPSVVEHVVLRPEDPVVQSIELTSDPVVLQNLLGAEFTTTRVFATFPAAAVLDAISERDLEIVIITPNGERRCNVDNDRIYEMFGVENKR